MKIRGKYYLDSNLYDSIVIANSIIVSSPEERKRKKIPDSLWEEIRDLNDQDQINVLLKDFLENNKISFINERMIYNNRKYITFGSIRVLKTNRDLTDDQLLMILTKYKNDRINDILENDYDVVKFNDSKSETSYCGSDNKLEVTLYLDKYSNLFEFEREFLLKYLNYIFGKNKAQIHVEYEYYKDYKEMKGLYIIGSNKKLEFSVGLYIEMCKVVDEHNKMVEEKTSLKLKREEKK